MATIAEMTPEELRALIESIIEEKLLELLGDPDEGYALRKAVRERSCVSSVRWRPMSEAFRWSRS